MCVCVYALCEHTCVLWVWNGCGCVRTHASNLLAVEVGLSAVAHEPRLPQPCAEVVIAIERLGKLQL